MFHGYILDSKPYGTLCVEMTSDLATRAYRSNRS
jgi:hypothetical protein